MTRFITLIMLALVLATGCAHQSLNRRQVATSAASVAVVASLIVLAFVVPCSDCNRDLTPAAR